VSLLSAGFLEIAVAMRSRDVGDSLGYESSVGVLETFPHRSERRLVRDADLVGMSRKSRNRGFGGL